jgi:hypothetical protein
MEARANCSDGGRRVFKVGTCQSRLVTLFITLNLYSVGTSSGKTASSNSSLTPSRFRASSKRLLKPQSSSLPPKTSPTFSQNAQEVRLKLDRDQLSALQPANHRFRCSGVARSLRAFARPSPSPIRSTFRRNFAPALGARLASTATFQGKVGKIHQVIGAVVDGRRSAGFKLAFICLATNIAQSNSIPNNSQLFSMPWRLIITAIASF